MTILSRLRRHAPKELRSYAKGAFSHCDNTAQIVGAIIDRPQAEIE